MPLEILFRDGPIIDGVLMGADISPTHVIDLGPGGQKFVALHIQTTQGAGAPDHVGVVKWELSNIADAIGSFTSKGSYNITTGAAINRLEDNITTSARFMRVWYDWTSGGTDDTLRVFVHTCADRG